MQATKRLLLACVVSSSVIDEEVIEVIESEDDDQDADQDADQDVEQEQEDGEMDDWLASDGDVSPVSSSRGDWTDEESFTSSSDIANTLYVRGGDAGHAMPRRRRCRPPCDQR